MIAVLIHWWVRYPLQKLDGLYVSGPHVTLKPDLCANGASLGPQWCDAGRFAAILFFMVYCYCSRLSVSLWLFMGGCLEWLCGRC